MLLLHYANQLEALIEPLLAQISTRQRLDPFTPINLIVPNASVAHFIRFQVAQKLGVSAHLSFHYLRRYLTEQVQTADPKIRILEVESLQLLLFEHLNTPEVLQRVELESVRTYLDIAESPEEREGRCIQLAGQLARLFEEYGYARREMLTAWREGRSGLTQTGEGSEEINVQRGPWLRAERWQRVLWRGLFDEDGSIRIYPVDGHVIEGLEGLEAPKTRRQKGSTLSASSRRRRARSQQPALFLTEEDQQQVDPRAHLRARGRRGEEVARWMFLPEALSSVESQLQLPDDLFIFGLSYVAPAYAQIISRLSALTAVHIFALNPCREFWEDVDNRLNAARQGWISRSERVDDFLEREDPFNLEDPDDTPALRLWGRPGREYIRTLNQLTECEFESHFVDPRERRQLWFDRSGEESILNQVQGDILNRAEARPALLHDLENDRTIRLIASPGIRREVEIIADEIWSLFCDAERRGETLRFHEIAVMVTDAHRHEYFTHIEAIFRERFQLPFNMIDRSLSAQSRVLEAALRLIALPLGDLSYLEVIGVACHPLIGGATGADLEEWRRWGDLLNVRFGADESALSNTYIDRDVYHWDQGLKRLLLGLFMEGERSGDERIFEVEERAWVPLDVGGDQLGSAGQMIHLIRCLIIDANQASSHLLSLSRWCQFFTRFLTRYLHPQSSADEQALSRCIETIDELKQVDLEGSAIRYEVAQTMLSARLRQLDSTRGQHQADGIVVSSLLPMRAIPFNTIYILGLGEQEFPAKTPQDPLDLRQAQQLAGDVSPSQRDRYLFLETLLSARERLVLSYVAFDDRTGDPLEPSAVVRELHFILRGYLGPSGLPAEVHPLSAFSASYDRPLPPNASTESASHEASSLLQSSPATSAHPLDSFDQSPELASDHEEEDASEGDLRLDQDAGDVQGWHPTPTRSPDVLRGIRAHRLREELNLFIGGHTIPREELQSAIKLWSREDLNRFLELSSPPQLDRDENAITRLTLRDLRAFLISPLQGSARAMLRLSYEEIGDQEATLNDPLFYRYLERFQLLQDSFWQGGGERSRTAEIYDELYERAALKGETPVGFFALEQRRLDGDVLNTWLLNANQFQLRRLDQWLAVSIGEGREFEEVSRRLPPVQLQIPLPQGGESVVELVGRISPLRPDFGATLHCVPSGGVGEHLFLTGFLEMVFLAAAQQPLPKIFSVYLNPYSDFRAERLHRKYFTPTPAQARQYLQSLVAELTQGFHAYRLPIKAVLKWRENLIRDPSAPLRIKPEEQERGPIVNLRPFPLPPPSVAIEMVQRRLGPWFNAEVIQ